MCPSSMLLGSDLTSGWGQHITAGTTSELCVYRPSYRHKQLSQCWQADWHADCFLTSHWTTDNHHTNVGPSDTIPSTLLAQRSLHVGNLKWHEMKSQWTGKVENQFDYTIWSSVDILLSPCLEGNYFKNSNIVSFLFLLFRKKKEKKESI